MTLFKLHFYDEWENDSYYYLFNTRKEAEDCINKMLELGYISEDEDYYIEEISIDTVESVIARKREEYEEIARIKEQERKEIIEENRKSLSVLTELKALFEPYDLSDNDKIVALIPELHKLTVKANLPVTYFDGETDYYSDGRVKKWNGRERISYVKGIYVYPTENGMHFRYSKVYDIDDDIKNVKEELAEI